MTAGERDIVERLRELSLRLGDFPEPEPFAAKLVWDAAVQIEALLRRLRSPAGEEREEGALSPRDAPPVPSKLWLWRNGPREFWAFEHCYPIYMDHDDPQTLGQPAGYAILKPSRSGRPADEKPPEEYAYFLRGEAHPSPSLALVERVQRYLQVQSFIRQRIFEDGKWAEFADAENQLREALSSHKGRQE